tara:strand:+ start:1313 stop:1558 length:246 start_codon:yes stop_codon:yes gene_type:complete
MTVVEILNQYGFATLAAVAMGYFIYFIYKFTTENIKQKLSEANVALIGLLDRIRMLDNDLIRLRSKLQTARQIKENQKKNK